MPETLAVFELSGKTRPARHPPWVKILLFPLIPLLRWGLPPILNAFLFAIRSNTLQARLYARQSRHNLQNREALSRILIRPKDVLE